MLLPTFALITIAAAPAAKLDEIRARGRLIVAVKNEGPKSPAAHKDPAHFQKRNFELELARRIARRILGDERKLDLRILPRPDRLPALARGEVDLVISMIQVNDAAKSIADFSAPYYEGGFALVVRPGSPIKSPAELDGKKVALIAQNANDPRARINALFAERGQKVTVTPFQTFKLAAEALTAGRVDALVSYNPNVEAFLAATKLELTKLPELLTRDRYAVAVKKGEGALLGEVDETIAELRSSGELTKLAEKHGLP